MSPPPCGGDFFCPEGPSEARAVAPAVPSGGGDLLLETVLPSVPFLCCVPVFPFVFRLSLYGAFSFYDAESPGLVP